MYKYAALFSYRGTNFCGWQKQEGAGAAAAPSIQETIEAALKSITQESMSVVGSGRTDSGVHALGQVAHFRLKEKEWDPNVLRKGLNSRLPLDIRVIALRAAPADFHAQRSAEKKQYSYYFQQGPTSLPHLAPYSWWIHRKLDQQAMQRALDHLKGEHDFKPFQASGSKPLKSTVREIIEAEAVWEPIAFPGLARPEFGFMRIRLVGTGFLKQMVRGIAGTLLQVGEGRRDPSCIREILESGDRSEVGQTAPAKGLWLEKVWYPLDF